MTGTDLKSILRRTGKQMNEIAASIDIPDDVISLALGHSARNATTAIYIERDRKKVDDANRRVIDWVWYGKKG